MKKRRVEGPIVEMERVEIKGGVIEIEARVKVKVKIPEQNEQLPAEIEREMNEAGQEVKREMYRQVIERESFTGWITKNSS